MANPNELLQQLGAQQKLLTDAVAGMNAQRAVELERGRGVKIIRLPVITATAANPFAAGGVSGPVIQQPDQGYVWSLRHLVIEGLTRGANPDVVQITRGADGRVLWELNGNQYAQTWGRGEIPLFPGESLAYQSVGAFAATGKIIIHGTTWEAPAEQAYKLAT